MILRPRKILSLIYSGVVASFSAIFILIFLIGLVGQHFFICLVALIAIIIFSNRKYKSKNNFKSSL